MRKFSGFFAVGLAALAVACAPMALADLEGNAFYITASNDDGTASYTVPLEELTYDGESNTYTWASTGPVDLEDDDGDIIATLTSANVFIDGDPAVNFGFAVQAGNSDTTFLMGAASVVFGAINNALAQAGAAFTITDQFNRDGVKLTTVNQAGRAYNASYNSGTTFADLVADFEADPGQSRSSDENKPAFGYELLVDPVSQIESSVNFTLTTGDLASGTNSFEVIPEPSTLVLVALGALSMLRRNR